MGQLDLKDKKILLELDLNSRQSYSSIGKKVGLSKEVVNYRISKLIENKIISNFTAIIDFSRLGIIACRTFLSLENLDANKKEEIINYLKNIYQVGWGVTIIGRWDINFIFWGRNMSEFNSFWDKFYTKYGRYIDIKITNISDWYLFYPKAFLVSKYLDEIPFYNYYKQTENKINLDEKELKILSILARNSRTKINDISKEVDLSPTTVLSKIKSFEKDKIILSYNIGVDINKLGYSYFKLHLNIKNFDKKRYDSLIAYFNYQENIWATSHLIGGDDIELDIYIDDEKKYMEFLDNLRSKFSDIIKNYETIKYFEEFKYNLFPIKIK